MKECRFKWGSHCCTLPEGHTDTFCECKCGIRDPHALEKRQGKEVFNIGKDNPNYDDAVAERMEAVSAANALGFLPIGGPSRGELVDSASKLWECPDCHSAVQLMSVQSHSNWHNLARNEGKVT